MPAAEETVVVAEGGSAPLTPRSIAEKKKCI